MQIKMPKMASNMEKGQIGRWLKKDGDMVEKNQILYELLTDKAVFEVESPDTGILKIMIQEGSTANVGDILGELNPSPTVCPIFKLKEKLLIIGTGKGSQIVKDIVGDKYNIVGEVDITPEWIEKLREYQFDYLIISFTKDMEARKNVFLGAKAMGYKFINVIHPKALIENNTEVGEGNLIYAMSRIGPFTKVGDNNVISAFTNIEHHNKVGSHILFGPHCSTSGTVTIGDGCKFGTGIFIQDNIEIGENVMVASGKIIINNVPSNSCLRTQIRYG